MSRSSRLLPLLLLSACFAELELPGDAQLVCGDGVACPAGSRCVAEVARCIADDSPCLLKDGALAGNGSDCGDGVRCVDGACVPPSCGDGLVDEGEQCDPRNDAFCRDSCVLASCGDGILDPNEGCDSDREDCVGCTQICAPDRADCDLDVTNGCECETARVLVDRLVIVDRGVVSGDFAYLDVEEVLSETTTRHDLLRVNLRTNEVEVLVEEIIGAHFAQDENFTWMNVISPSESLLSLVVNDEVTPAAESFGLGIALADGELYVSHLEDGIYRHDPFTGDTLDKIPGEACAFACFMSSCGSDLIVIEAGGERAGDVERARVDDGFIKRLFRFEASTGIAGIGFGCANGDPIWREGRNVFVDDGGDEDEPRAIAVVPSLNTQLLRLTPIVMLGDEPVVSGLFDGVSGSAFRLRPFGGARSIGDGVLLDIPGQLFFFQNRDSTIRRVVPPTEQR